MGASALSTAMSSSFDMPTLMELRWAIPWIENPSLKNFAPRIGFAWDVGGDGKTAIRGGAGLFFQQFDQSWYRTSGFRTPPILVEAKQRPAQPLRSARFRAAGVLRRFRSRISIKSVPRRIRSIQPIRVALRGRCRTSSPIKLTDALCHPVQPEYPARDSPEHGGDDRVCRLARN